MELEKLKLLDIQPSQFYVSEDKIRAVKGWFRKEDLGNFEPLPVKALNGRVIFTDGHTRAWVAYTAGLERVPLVWDLDELDWEAYQMCVDACVERNVTTVADFEGRVLSGPEYREKWNGWCDRLHQSLEQKRGHRCPEE